MRGSFVSQKQFKSALARIGKDQRRNAVGIRTINKRMAATDRRVSAVASVNRVQSRHIASLHKMNKIDGALDISQSFNPETGQIDLVPLIRGALKSGFFGTPKGLLGEPLAIGALALLLRQDSEGNALITNILGGGQKG